MYPSLQLSFPDLSNLSTLDFNLEESIDLNTSLLQVWYWLVNQRLPKHRYLSLHSRSENELFRIALLTKYIPFSTSFHKPTKWSEHFWYSIWSVQVNSIQKSIPESSDLYRTSLSSLDPLMKVVDKIRFHSKCSNNHTSKINIQWAR